MVKAQGPSWTPMQIWLLLEGIVIRETGRQADVSPFSPEYESLKHLGPNLFVTLDLVEGQTFRQRDRLRLGGNNLPVAPRTQHYFHSTETFPTSLLLISTVM
jgi:hypothetical protein